MPHAQLSFLSDQYYLDFPDDKQIEQNKIKKYGSCNTIRFGTVLGRNAAFLIQNMCPATERYLNEYIDRNKQPIRIDGRVAADVEKNARDVLAMAKCGEKVIFPVIWRSLFLKKNMMSSCPMVYCICSKKRYGIDLSRICRRIRKRAR